MVLLTEDGILGRTETGGIDLSVFDHRVRYRSDFYIEQNRYITTSIKSHLYIFCENFVKKYMSRTGPTCPDLLMSGTFTKV